MSRNLDTAMAARLGAGAIIPAVLAMLTFASGPRYLWTGPGTLTVAGQTYTGIGSLGTLGNVSEGVEVKAEGTTVSLSGIDPVYLAESMTDIKLGSPAKLSVALLTPQLQVIGTPYPFFVGVVDQPTVNMQGTTCGITLALENKLIDLQRATNRRYTAADQRVAYPSDTAFNRVEGLNDIALKWGQA